MLRTLHPQPPRRDSRGQHDALKALEVGGAHARAELHLLRVRLGLRLGLEARAGARVGARARVGVWVRVRSGAELDRYAAQPQLTLEVTQRLVELLLAWHLASGKR